MNPPTTLAAGHVGDLVDDRITRLAARMWLLDPESAFLRERAAALVGDGAPREALLDAIARLGHQHHERLGDPSLAGHALVIAARELRLSGFEIDLALFAALPWLDDRYLGAFGRLGVLDRQGQATLAGALSVLVSSGDDRGPIRDCLARTPLWQHRILATDTPESTPFERPLRPSIPFVASLDRRIPRHLHGHPVAVCEGVSKEQAERSLAFRPSWSPLLERLVTRASSSPFHVMHLIEASRGDADLLAEALSWRRGRPCAVLRLPTEHVEPALREASLLGALSGIDVIARLPIGVEELEVPEDLWARGLVLLATPPASHVRGVDARGTLPRPTALEQASLWKHHLGTDVGQVDVDLLASRTHLSVTSVQRAAEAATRRARHDGRRDPDHADVVRALEDIDGAPSSRLATTRRPVLDWRALVLEREPKSRLADLVRRVKYRATVQDRWGMGSPNGRGDGIVAVLHGESGTGKTYAADAVASRLDLPLLGVDLSRVVSKYIGESEKHLAELFDVADGYRAVLFFDEADALFGKRTGVRDAHDRFANIEVNFLLQRLEAFEGLAVLATNMLQNLDDAFTRRIHFSIHLPRPTPAQQLQIWRQHLPAERLDEGIDMEAVVTRFDLVGGEIRNVALTSAYAAAARGSVITEPLLRDAVRQELVKRGRPVPRN